MAATVGTMPIATEIQKVLLVVLRSRSDTARSRRSDPASGRILSLPRWMMRRPTRSIGNLLVFLALYAACYRAMVRRRVNPVSAQTVAHYAIHDSSCQILLAPAHGLDRCLRPDYWGQPACVW